MAKLTVVYYSSYGHTYTMAQEIAKGAEAEGAEVRIRRVPELVPPEVIQGNEGLKAGAELQSDVPEASNEDLLWADAIAFGSPTRFGNMTAQMKNFLDQTGALWAEGTLSGKLAGFFTGSNTMHGGQETTILTMSTYAYHMGMLIVPVGYDISEVATTSGGGSPYGASHVAGPDGSKQPSSEALAIASYLGSRLATFAAKLSS